MKITVFNGSPRGRDSNTNIIAQSLLEGAQEAGADCLHVYLVEKNIRHCRGCFSCWSVTPGVCVLQDDMKHLMDLFTESDFVCLGTPVYGMLMTGLLKNFTDRLLPLATPHIRKADDGAFYHNGRVRRFPGLIVVANSGFPGQHNFEMLKSYYKPQNPVLEIYRNCGEILSHLELAGSEVAKQVKVFLSAVKQAGRQIVTHGKVTQNVVELINNEIISDEEYMNRVNRMWDEEFGESCES